MRGAARIPPVVHRLALSISPPNLRHPQPTDADQPIATTSAILRAIAGLERRCCGSARSLEAKALSPPEENCAESAMRIESTDTGLNRKSRSVDANRWSCVLT